MKNKDFKRLGDDTKKMEKNMKLYHTGLIVNLILIFIIIVVALIIMLLKPNLISKNGEQQENEVQKEQQNVMNEEEPFENKVKFSNFKVEQKNNKYYIIGEKDSTLEDIAEVDSSAKILGVYRNNLYFYDNQAISYVSFESDENKIVEWLKYRQYKDVNSDKTGILSISKAYMYDKYIYFRYNVNVESSSSACGVLRISVFDNNFEDAESVVPSINDNRWVISDDGKFIYFVDNTKSFYKYDIEHKIQNILIENAESYKMSGDKILYLKLNNAYKEADNAIVQAATYYLYVYNLTTNENTQIYESSVANITTGSIDGFADLYNDEVYYKRDNEIVKYDNGKNTVVYKDDSSSIYLDGFKIINDTTIELRLQGGTKKYFVNGQVVDNI